SALDWGSWAQTARILSYGKGFCDQATYEGGGDHQPIGDRVEELAEGAHLVELASQVAVDPVGSSYDEDQPGGQTESLFGQQHPPEIGHGEQAHERHEVGDRENPITHPASLSGFLSAKRRARHDVLDVRTPVRGNIWKPAQVLDPIRGRPGRSAIARRLRRRGCRLGS